ncbi:MAG: arginine--tRNA ligase [Candidatus Gracilibacteria bacterium]|jgi:arginyl-tRNA synthetase|nr:arginine--tRNA ligase [Candidatus Gracilibacteria bacterium]
MKFQIDPKIFENFPDLKIGLIIIKNFSNYKRISATESLLRGIQAQKAKEFYKADADSVPSVAVWNYAYEHQNIDPKKYTPLLKTIYKTVQSGQEIPHTNPLSDIAYYYSIKYLLPINHKDLSWLCGDLRLAYTQGTEPFREINSINVENATENEIAYMDEGGIIQRFWNFSECERTKITDKSVNTALFVEDLSKLSTQDFAQILSEIANNIQKYLGGEIIINVLNQDLKEAELGVEGRKNVDDSKISAQEKAYYTTRLAIQKEDQNKKIINFSARMPQVSVPILEPLSTPTPMLQKNSETKNDFLSLKDESTLKFKIEKILEKAILKAFSPAPKVQIKIDYPASTVHGDFSCNIAMQLAKNLSVSPLDIAKQIMENIPEDDLLEKVELAPPGFINFFLSTNAKKEELASVLEKKTNYGKVYFGEGKTIVMDYSSPNIAKPFGIHHIITTILGQSLYNMYREIGFKTVSVNHIGDYGTQFGKLIVAYKKWGEKKEIEKNPIDELQKIYVKFHEEVEKDDTLEDEARLEFKKFEEGDKENRRLWKWFVEESLKEFQKTYNRLGGMHFDHIQGESFYEDKLDDILKEGKQRGVFVEGEEGAFVVKFDEPDMPPLVVQKKDNSTLYSTRDFATMKYRISTWHPFKIFYVIGGEQTLQFKQLFKACERFPWYHGEGIHIPYGRMSFKDKKFSTRKGDFIKLDEVLDEAVSRVKTLCEAKSKSTQDLEKLAEIIGIGAVKYNVLSQNRLTNIVFDWDKMLSLDGNSAVYLQYAYARARSILRKAKEEPSQKSKNEEGTEKIDMVLRLIPLYKEKLLESCEDFRPNILCNYLYELAKNYNSLYNAVPMLTNEDENERKLLIEISEAVSQIIKNGLNLLGIFVAEEM